MEEGEVSLDPGFLRARVLRYWVCLELRRENTPLSVAELVVRLEARGLRVHGRPSKAISDTLRWATNRGWAYRAERGRYRPGRMRPQTAAYMQSVVTRAIEAGDPAVARTAQYRAWRAERREGLADVAVAALPEGGAQFAAEDLA